LHFLSSLACNGRTPVCYCVLEDSLPPEPPGLRPSPGPRRLRASGEFLPTKKHGFDHRNGKLIFARHFTRHSEKEVNGLISA
jgi:hypothetical protein